MNSGERSKLCNLFPKKEKKKKKKRKEKRKAINLWILNTKMEKVMRARYHYYGFSAGFSLSAGKALCNASQPEVRKESGTGNLIISTRPKANFSPTLLKSYGGKRVTEQIKAISGL